MILFALQLLHDHTFGRGFFFCFFFPVCRYTVDSACVHFKLPVIPLSAHSVINESMRLGGGRGKSQLVSTILTVCAYTPRTPSHTAHRYTEFTGCTVQTSRCWEEIVCSGCPCQLPTWKRVVRKTHHSHRQGPKLIKSTVDSVKRKVYPSHFLVSGNGTRCLVVIASRCHAESVHILMNAAICMHKQLLRVYQSKLLYLQ